MLDLGRGQAPRRFVSSFIPFHADLRGPSWSGTRLARELVEPELRSLIAKSKPPLSTVPRRVRAEPSSRRTRSVGTAGTTVEQLDLPFGLRQGNTQGTSDAVDSDRVGFLPYGPLVSDWLAFLAERLTAEFLRDMARGPRP
jgi:hypothetical protein